MSLSDIRSYLVEESVQSVTHKGWEVVCGGHPGRYEAQVVIFLEEESDASVSLGFTGRCASIAELKEEVESMVNDCEYDTKQLRDMAETFKQNGDAFVGTVDELVERYNKKQKRRPKP